MIQKLTLFQVAKIHIKTVVPVFQLKRNALLCICLFFGINPSSGLVDIRNVFSDNFAVFLR